MRSVALRWLRALAAGIGPAPSRAGGKAAARRGGRRRGAGAGPAAPPDASALTAESARRLEAVLRRHGVHVHRWRRRMSGVAWNGPGPAGPLTRWIEAPLPRSSMSWAVLLHEVAHHAIGIGRFRPRCLEEYLAWRWALEAMGEEGIEITPAVRARMRASLRYAAEKAQRRGLVRLPPELAAYLASAE